MRTISVHDSAPAADKAALLDFMGRTERDPFAALITSTPITIEYDRSHRTAADRSGFRIEAERSRHPKN